MNNKTALSLFVIGKKHEQGTLYMPGDVFEDFKSYSTGNGRLRLHEENEGRPIPEDWKNGSVTISAYRVPGSQDSGCCVKYYITANGAVKEM